MSELLIVILVIVSIGLTGRSLLALIDRICGTLDSPRLPSEVWGISILMGVSFTAAAGFVWSDLGGQLNRSLALRQAIIGAILGIVATVQSFRRRSIGAIESPASSSPFLTRMFRVVFGLVIIGAFILPALSIKLTDQALSDPAHHKQHEEIQRKAQILFQTGTIDAPALVPESGYPYHFREPLLLPLAERHVDTLWERPSDLADWIWSPLCLAGLGLSFAGVLTRRASTAWGWILATGLTVMPILWSERGLLARSGDLPLACFHGVAVLYLWDALQDSPGRLRVRGLLLASGMASSAVFTKSEGLAYLVVEMVAWMFTLPGGTRSPEPAKDPSETPRSWKQDLLGIAIFALFAAFLLTPWMLYRQALPVDPQSIRWVRPQIGPPEFLRELFSPVIRDWWKTGLPWWLMGLALVSSPRRSLLRPQRFLILTLLGALGAAEFVLAPAGLSRTLDGSSQTFLLQLTPIAVLLMAAVWTPSGHDGTAGPSSVP